MKVFLVHLSTIMKNNGLTVIVIAESKGQAKRLIYQSYTAFYQIESIEETTNRVFPIST